MNVLEAFLTALVRGIRIFIRDIAGPCIGLFLVVQLGRGAIDNPAAIPVVGGLATSLIFGPYWLYQDRQNRDDGDKPRKSKSIRITKDGISWGDDGDEPPARK